MTEDNNLHWRDSLPSGWGALYETLLADLSAAGFTVNVPQAKEKFGMMRVYLEQCPDDAMPILLAAERSSGKICQVCGGAAGLRVRNHVYATLCDQHGEGWKMADEPPMLSMNIRGRGIDD
ncbi:hypothetical protein [Sphingomonas sp. C3-2]|uniref:hypothetical protein n=1 Tax=Sphingomonas sp. C3-2 TaxID=3062169 RepID=UPI00294B4A5F|nr:hypothetical protein [Sphingomonas sp. C3-2]WOK35466.1 hypothetical protein QYC26_10605 [Sphingomonas sp. C3-2]